MLNILRERLRLPSTVTGNYVYSFLSIFVRKKMSEKYSKSEQENPSCHQPGHGSCHKDHSKRPARLSLDATRVEKISYIARLPDEILEKILTEALLSSGYSWPSHVCQTYNDLKNVSVRFCHITRRLAWTLPSIHFANGGEAGIVGVKTLLRKFGPASGVMIEVNRILATRRWKHAHLKLRFRGQGWFVIEKIIWK